MPTNYTTNLVAITATYSRAVQNNPLSREFHIPTIPVFAALYSIAPFAPIVFFCEFAQYLHTVYNWKQAKFGPVYKCCRYDDSKVCLNPISSTHLLNKT